MDNIVSINNGYEILSRKENKNILNEIKAVIENAPLPVYKNKSKKQPEIDVVQQILNTYIKQMLEGFGWKSEVDISPSEFKDSLKSDFRKSFLNENGTSISVQMEVEFGNAASFYRDVTKIQTSHAFNMADIGIIILPSHSLSKRIDTGLANIEKASREKHVLESISTIPLIIIGLDDYCMPEWDVKNITENIEIIKGAKIEYRELHNNIVKPYVEEIMECLYDISL